MLFILIAFSLLSIFLEFYLPGGVLTIVGALIAIVAFFEAYYIYGAFGCILVLLLYAVLIFGVIKLALALIRRSGENNSFFLSTDQRDTKSVEDLSALSGEEGVALSELSPSGFALIANKRFQVLSQGPYVEKGESIIVVDSRGGYLIVKSKNPKGAHHADTTIA
jgi:membrane-bound serine protease (ClpP class)